MNDSRIFWGFVDHHSPHANPQFGLVHVLFEELENGRLVGNQRDTLFCPTGKVFIKNDFDSLKNNFPNTLIRVEAIPSNFEIKEAEVPIISC